MGGYQMIDGLQGTHGPDMSPFSPSPSDGSVCSKVLGFGDNGCGAESGSERIVPCSWTVLKILRLKLELILGFNNLGASEV
jgi:hypothetical protein